MGPVVDPDVFLSGDCVHKRNALKLNPCLVSPLTDLEANDCMCGIRSQVNQIRKHISSAGL